MSLPIHPESEPRPHPGYGDTLPEVSTNGRYEHRMTHLEQPGTATPPMEHDVTLLHAFLSQHEETIREMELSTTRKVLRKPRALKGIVGAPRTIVADGLEYAAYRAHDAGNGMAGAVDRAEEALRHEKALARSQRILGWGATVVSSVSESGGAYLSDRAERIGHALDTARSGVRNKKAILTASKIAHWVGRKLERISEPFDRTLPN